MGHRGGRRRGAVGRGVRVPRSLDGVGPLATDCETTVGGCNLDPRNPSFKLESLPSFRGRVLIKSTGRINGDEGIPH